MKEKTYREWATEFIQAGFGKPDVYLKRGILLTLASIADEIRSLTMAYAHAHGLKPKQ